MASRVPLALTVVLVVAVTGCSSNYVKRGSALYADGRYVEAAEVFEHTEHRLNDATPREAAEYGLYRGLTLLVLGDLPNAHRWLTYAYQVEEAHPGSLRSNRRALLDSGWYELGKLLYPDSDRAPHPPTALAASEPAPSPEPPEPAARAGEHTGKPSPGR